MGAELKAEEVNCLSRLEKEMHDSLVKTYNMWFNEELPDDYPCEETIDELYKDYERMGGRTLKRVIIAQAIIESYDSLTCKRS